MLWSFRSRFGIPGVISVIALVFAMFGGAYAASNSGQGDATASAQKNSKAAKKGAKGPRGPKGATGPAGPAGPAGAKGDAGAAGQNGANGNDGAAGNNGAAGANGKTVLNGTAVPTAAVGTIGDFYLETDISKMYGPKAASGANGGWGAGTDLKGADGAEGSPWTAGGTLPSEETETGAWGFVESAGSGTNVFVPVSFPIPLEAAFGSAAIHIAPDANCPGTVQDPQANPGHFCVYPGQMTGAAFDTAGFIGPEPVANPALVFCGCGQPQMGKSGAVLKFVTTAAFASGGGTWAVTAAAE
jgi:Collagen triple helix repeat (20 copies)